MSDDLVSTDEFLSARKDFVKGGNVIMKAARAPASWNGEKRTARFVMSAEVEDRDRDVIVQAGLDTDEFMKNPTAPFAHMSRTFPVGTWSDIEKVLTGRPKRTEGTLNLVPEGMDGVADRLAAHIGVGTIRTCSIGFIPRTVRKRDVPEEKKNEPYYYPGYSIDEAELVECSPVAIPANPAAFAKDAASDGTLGREIVEEILDTWAKHPETGLIVPRSEFEAAYKQATGERTTVIVTAPAKTAPAEPAPGILRRAVQALFGNGDVPDEARDLSMADLAPAAKAERERQKRAAEVADHCGRILRRHRAEQRLAAVRGRVEARNLT